METLQASEKQLIDHGHKKCAPESSMDEGVTSVAEPLAKFAHIDEKKVLRKVRAFPSPYSYHLPPEATTTTLTRW